ncbi:MAG: hypothetical protein WBM96_14175 [Polyangiales bacterium]|jgi:hypothetical protein
MVDLEHRYLRQAVEQIRPRVEAGAENPEPIDAPGKRANRIVDEWGARDGGRAGFCSY